MKKNFLLILTKKILDTGNCFFIIFLTSINFPVILCSTTMMLSVKITLKLKKGIIIGNHFPIVNF